MSEGGDTNQQAPWVLWCQVGAGLLVLLAVGVLAYNFDDVMHTLREPPLVSLKDLDRAEQVSELPRGRVRLDCSSAVEIKLRLVGKRYGSDEEKARYLAVRTGDHYLIAEVPPQGKGTVVEGALYKSDHPIDAEVREFAEKEHPRLRGKLKPFNFSSVITANPGRDVMTLSVLLAVLGLGAWGFSWFAAGQGQVQPPDGGRERRASPQPSRD
jgi:hypothetical protein